MTGPEGYPTDERVAALVSQLTAEEKAAMTAGSAMFALQGAPRLGVPTWRVTDGPNGARGSALLGTGEVRAVCIPCGSALGATWDPVLVEAVGVLLGDEARTKRCRVLLAPTVNLHRSPLGGRTFECYSEDPLLTGKIAAAFVRGVQSRGVITTVKHFVGNDAETERNTVNSVIDERALRELYLLPFEVAVREGGALGIMSAYNRLNGRYCTENRELLTDILRNEWGFEGFVMTDWFSPATTVDSVAAGLDIEMPGPSRVLGTALGTAVSEGRVDEASLDLMVSRQLSALARVGALDGEDADDAELSIDLPEHRALARRCAAEAMVLLKNDDVLPFTVGTGRLRKLAVIGPNADRVQIMGGGSANLRPMYRTSPLDAIRARLGDRTEDRLGDRTEDPTEDPTEDRTGVELTYEPGCAIDRSAPVLLGSSIVNAQGRPGFLIEIFANAALDGAPVGVLERDTSRLLFMEALPAGVSERDFSARASTTFTPTISGAHVFEIVQMGFVRLFVDGNLVLDGWDTRPPLGSLFFGQGSVPIVAELDLRAGSPAEIVIEFRPDRRSAFVGLELGCRQPLPVDAMERAVAAAADADAVVLIVGTNDDWETEGEDRRSMDLPGRQDELVTRVLAANPRTAVVVNTGSPVTMPWADARCAIVQAWFGGQEMGNALVDVLTGVVDPGGRLPTTFPVRLEHNPSFGNFPGERGEVRYGESVLMGYRWYQTRRLPVRFPFGHGLSYTTFSFGPASVSASTFTAGGILDVMVEVTNTGQRPGAQVLQCYVRPHASLLVRPQQELKAFAKVHLEPGASTMVTLRLDDRSFAYWDPAEPGWPSLRDHIGDSLPLVQLIDRRTDAGWRIDDGEYDICVGTSCENIVTTATIRVKANAPAPTPGISAATTGDETRPIG